MSAFNYKKSIWYIEPQCRLLLCSMFGLWLIMTDIKSIIGYHAVNFGLMLASMGAIICFIEMIITPKDQEEAQPPKAGVQHE